MRKADWKKAFVLLRNGFAFVFSWLVILITIIGILEGGKAIRINAILGAALISLVGVICFVIFFSDAFIRNKSFIFRLTFAAIVFVPSEIAGLYIAGFFSNRGNLGQWFIFTGLVVAFYGICVLIDNTIYKKQGKKYTVELLKYQEKRRNDNDKD